VDALFVERVGYFGLLHHQVVKSQETGTQEMMPIQEHNKYQDVPDGLYQLVDNSRIQDILVELIGIPTAASATGVVQREIACSHGGCASLMVLSTAASIRRILTVSVPSGVFLIELCTL
jgi:hypothetical protein